MTNARTLTKVAECLYRNGHGTYFALLKVRGKQIKKSLKTEDSALARRRLASVPNFAYRFRQCRSFRAPCKTA
jgi:hypothetical protein